MPQRAAVSSIGETWPSASLPAIGLPPQNSVAQHEQEIGLAMHRGRPAK